VATNDFLTRAAVPADAAALLRLKQAMALAEDTPFLTTASEEDWRRDCFGASAHYSAFVAEQQGRIVAMAICSDRWYAGWAGRALFVQDLFVEQAFRRQGIATALLACVAALATERGAAFVELTVREDNPARKLYRALGFERVRNCAIYVAGQAALAGATDETGMRRAWLESNRA
jgi:ribosomal protein S18 acetylase RimI-like enzyme